GEVTLEIRDAAGALVRTFTGSGPGTKEEVFQAMREPVLTLVGEPRVRTSAGMHRLVWDLRYPPAYLAPGVNEGFRQRIAPITGDTDGPYALPGAYTATLRTADGWSQSQTFDVVMDPRVTSSFAELKETFDLGIRARDRITGIQLGVARGQLRIRELNAAIAAGGAGAQEAARQKAEMEAVLGQLYKHGLTGKHSDLRPELTTDYANILTLIYGADARPTSNAYPRMEELDARYRDLMNRLTRLLERPIVDG
ncbi:MAG: hypothetical protein Q8N53_03815, partial [Longimicrobiales bacterium]|nr:hypothetical protein [Longimicrobiales bacterium]